MIKELCKKLTKEMDESYGRIPTEELYTNLCFILLEEGYDLNLKWDEMFFKEKTNFWTFIAEKDGVVTAFNNYACIKQGLKQSSYTYYSYELAKESVI